MNAHKDTHDIYMKKSESCDIGYASKNEECQDLSNKNGVEITNKLISDKLTNIDKQLTKLSERVKVIEKTIFLNEIVGNLKKHYEQTRRYK